MRLAAAATALCLSIVGMSVADDVHASIRNHTDIPAQGLGAALQTLARDRNFQIIFVSEEVNNLQTPGAVGEFTSEEALKRLLTGTGLTFQYLDQKTVTIVTNNTTTPPPAAPRRESPAIPGDPAEGGLRLAQTESTVSSDTTPAGDSPQESHADGLDEVLITGSRIRGAPVASPVIVETQQQMRDAGYTSLAEVISTIPQNFTGSQNPEANIGNVPERNGQSLGPSSSFDLRGLGGDATLTLLNGHRLAYNAAFQAIDVSAIPLMAVDRIEVVADGSSALYGSDAVAGVANIILKRDYNGLSATARIGASTDGGNNQHQYSLVGGKTWSTGGFLIAWDMEHISPIDSYQRSYAAQTAPGLTLFPDIQRHNVVVTGHQALASNLTFDLDAIYNTGSTATSYALDSAGLDTVNGAVVASDSSSFAVAPSLELALRNDWRLALTGMFGADNTHYGHYFYENAIDTSPTVGCYCNKADSVELSADGHLFRLPGGDAKLAVGGGYRSNTYHGFRTVGDPQDIDVSQATYYGFGELSLPLVSPQLDIPGVNRLSASGAVRYEHYPTIDHIFTPKLGLIYAPTADLDLKGSWGKSFRAPNFYERYSSQYTDLFPASNLGGSGYPPGATALLLSGGNPDLKPEKATTWAVTLGLHPRALENAKMEISYFNVKYVNRILNPIEHLSQSLADPIFNSFVNHAPSPSALTAAFAGREFYNDTTVDYDPTQVIAIVNNSNLNIAHQDIHGVDASAEYTLETNDIGTFRFTGNGSYLHSTEELSPGQAAVPLAGTIFNPPHFRSRAGVTWNLKALTFTSFVNYIGGVEDNRTPNVVQISSMTTLDATARYKIDSASKWLDDTDLTLTVQNALNKAPSRIPATYAYEAPYDSLNYSSIGRFVGFAVTKSW
jgi:iron complex outermembrane receptor protein